MSIRFSAAKQTAASPALQFLVRTLPPVYEPDLGWDRHAGLWNAWARGSAGVIATARGHTPWLAAQALVLEMREQKLTGAQSA